MIKRRLHILKADKKKNNCCFLILCGEKDDKLEQKKSQATTYFPT